MTPDANRNDLTELFITHLLLGSQANDIVVSLRNPIKMPTQAQTGKDDDEPSEEAPHS